MTRSNSSFWLFVLAAALIFQAQVLMHNVSAPWTDESDFNGACWSQSAHNTLRAGLWTTKGVPSAFYFGPLPIPSGMYYTHHPAVLSLMLTGMFAVLGEHEWVARLLPILFSLAATVLLFYLVKDCAGNRAGALAAVVFASLPMELHFGRMVNFEPLELAWMFAGLISLRRWEQTRALKWWLAVLATFALIFWTAWLGYMFLLILCLHYLVTARKKNPRMAFFFIVISFVSFLLFLAHISWVAPDAVSSLIAAFWQRISGSHVHETVQAVKKTTEWKDWFPRIFGVLQHHFQWLAWLLGAAGAVVVFRRGRANEPLWWLGAQALLFFVLSAFYITAFRNASYIHDYASFYFVAPIAIMAGIALDAFLGWSESRGGAAKGAGIAAASLAVLFLVLTGAAAEHEKTPGQEASLFDGIQDRLLAVSGVKTLRGQFHLLRYDIDEPRDLIPKLGALIKSSFPENADVVCNFIPNYGPHLAYYSQRNVLDGFADAAPDDWKGWLDVHSGPLGAVFWMGAPLARENLDVFPPGGTREEHEVAGFQFVIWKPGK